MTVADSPLSDKSAEEPPRDTKLCRICGERIPVAASFCTECEHYQDWRRYVTFSTTMVALLTALISVVASSAPTIRSMWRGAHTEITVSEQGLVGTELLLFAANSGTRDGGIASLYITGPFPGFAFSLQPVEPASTFIRAGSSSQIRLIGTRKLKMSFADLSEALKGGNTCKIHLTIIDLGKSNAVGGGAHLHFALAILEPPTRRSMSLNPRVLRGLLSGRSAGKGVRKKFPQRG